MKDRDDFANLAREILSGEWDEHLRGLGEACRARVVDRRTERDRFNAVSVKIGDTGTLEGISPRYLNGCPVRVTGKNRNTLDVIAIEGATTRQRERMGLGGRVPAGCFVPTPKNAREEGAET